MLKKTGERQVAVNLEGIREDHKARYVWAATRIKPTYNVMDAGCGVGYGSQLLSERAKTVSSVDVSSEAIEYAQRYWGQPNVSFSVQDLHFVSFNKNKKFNAIVAFEVIEHLIAPHLFLEQARKLLAAKGKIFISVPNERVIPHTAELNPFHMRHYTSNEAQELLVECGFNVDSIWGQDDSELTPDYEGKFLILEASPAANGPLNVPDEKATQAALSLSSELINTRATLLSKAKNDVQTLKKRVEQANKNNQTPAPNQLDSIVLQGLTQTLNNLDLRLKQTELNVNQKDRGSELRELEKELKLYEKQTLQVENQNAILLSEKETQKQKLSSLEAENQRLQTTLQDQSDLARQKAEEHHQYLYLKDRLEDKTNELLALKNTASESERQKNQQIDDLSERLRKEHEHFFETSISLQDKFSKVNEELHTTRIDKVKLSNELEEAKTSLATSSDALASATKQCSEKESVISELLAQQENYQSEVQNLNTKATELSSMCAEQQAQIESLEKNVKRLETNTSKAIDESKTASVHSLALASENETLRKANESLVSEMENLTSNLGSVYSESSGPKEPPSLGYMWRKLQYHHFYLPFIRRAIRNSLGLKKRRRV